MRMVFGVVSILAGGVLAEGQMVMAPDVARHPAFSHASLAGDLIFVAGTLGTVGDGPALAPGGVGAETRQTLENIRSILAAAGATLGDVRKVNVYLTSMDDFPAMNAVYLEFFPGDPPARATVAVKELALGALVEIECVAERRAAGAAGGVALFRETGFVEVDGERIYYESVGEGEAVVLSHGLGGNHAVWYQQVPVLAEEYRVITWDQRGFGRSTNVGGAASPVVAAGDLGALLDHLGIGEAHLVGQSMGGWAVLGFALDHPDRVKSLTLADTIGGIYTAGIEAHFDGYIREAAQSPPPDALPLGRHPALGDQLGGRDLAQAFLYTQIASVAEPAPATMGLQLRMTRYDVERIGALAMPVLFIVGEHDRIFPPAIIREAAGQIRNARVRVIADTGHSPYFEAAGYWNAALLDFLRDGR